MLLDMSHYYYYYYYWSKRSGSEIDWVRDTKYRFNTGLSQRDYITSNRRVIRSRSNPNDSMRFLIRLKVRLDDILI